MGKIPPQGIFYNRMSASSHVRGHRYAPEFTATILNWLKNHKRRVINNGNALALEISKSLQYLKLNESEIKSATEIKHFDFENKKLLKSINYLPEKEVIDIILTSGASCPDTVVENVLKKILDYFPTALSTDEILSQLEKTD